MAKKIKEMKFIHGTAIESMKGYRIWITCTLNNGEKVSLSLKKLLELLDQFDLSVEKYGDHWRVTGFEESELYGKIGGDPILSQD